MAKAYTTRVGSGPYPTELFGDHAEEIRAKGGEYGTTTGRPRRCGWLDMVALNYALEVTLLNLLLPSPPGSSHNHMQGDTQSSNTFLCNLHPTYILWPSQPPLEMKESQSGRTLPNCSLGQWEVRAYNEPF